MEKTAKIYTYTVVRAPAKAFAEKAPFAIGVLENDGEPKFSAFIEGYKDGMEINVGDIVYFSHTDEKGRAIYKF